MTHQLLFKHGALSSRGVDSVQTFLRQGYQHILLMSDLPPYEWRDKNFELFRSTGEDCMGNEYLKLTQMWGCFHVAAGTVLCLKSWQDREAVLRDHANLVIDAQPFETVVEVPKPFKQSEFVPKRKPLLTRIANRYRPPGFEIGLYWPAWYKFHYSEGQEPPDETGPGWKEFYLCIGPVQMRWKGDL